VLRWLEIVHLDALEQLVLHSARLQRFVVERHRRALDAILAARPPVRRGVIVGGGLFPRTALVLRQLAPYAAITIVDRSAGNLACAEGFLGDSVEYRHASYTPALVREADLVVVPLAFAGDRRTFFRHPPAPAVIVHDWIWQVGGDRGCVVSWLLAKRVNLVVR